MAKLSATSGMDTESITRVDITPEMIRTMRCNACKAADVPPGECRHASCEDLEELLTKLRGNREVSAQKAARSSTPRAPKVPKADDDDEKISI